MVSYVRVEKPAQGERLLIWRTEVGGWCGFLTGKTGATVTGMCSLSRWEELYNGPMAAFALLGRTPDNYPLQEII